MYEGRDCERDRNLRGHRSQGPIVGIDVELRSLRWELLWDDVEGSLEFLGL